MVIWQRRSKTGIKDQPRYGCVIWHIVIWIMGNDYIRMCVFDDIDNGISGRAIIIINLQIVKTGAYDLNACKTASPEANRDKTCDAINFQIIESCPPSITF